MNKPLSNNDICQLMDGETRVIRYIELEDFPSVESLLKPFGRVVILYPGGTDKRSEGVGHWTAVFYTFNDKGKPVIEFFDPYGFSIDQEFNYMGFKYPNLLAALLSRAKFPIEYNDKKVQSFARNIATCGRHVVNRLRHDYLSLGEYNRIFGGKNADRLVTSLTLE